MPFADIRGHRRALALLTTAVAQDRVPQSLLLAGPDGIGKRTVAIALAQAVNCPRRAAEAGDGCGRCPTCRRIALGQHSDVVLVDGDGEASIKIQALREQVLSPVGYRPFEGRRRVFIIDPADRLTTQSQDALLKTLEEPPPASLLVLVTTRPDHLAPTVLSRCRRLRFDPLSEGDLSRVLVERCGIDAGRAAMLAKASAGSVSTALAVEAGSVADDRKAALDVLTAAVSGQPVTVRLQAAAALARHGSRRRDREALVQRLLHLAALLREASALASGASADLDDDEAPSLRAVASRCPLATLVAAHAAVGDAVRWLRDQNASPKLVADWVALTVGS